VTPQLQCGQDFTFSTIYAISKWHCVKTLLGEQIYTLSGLGLILRLTKYVTEEDFQGRAESMGNKFSIDLTIIAKNIELPQVSDGE
jgi:hypothetical protein